MKENCTLTGKERTFPADEIIVSKTDVRGIITYANDIFISMSGYSEEEIIGKPHNLIRHPHMPRAVFKLLWDVIGQGKEIFAYVINRSKNGDHYWVLAHVTPNIDLDGKIVGFHSNRRAVRRSIIPIIDPLYRKLIAEEQRHSSPKDGLDISYKMMISAVKDAGFDSYDRFVLSI